MPSRERGIIVRDFPEFEHGTHDRPSVQALEQLYLRNARFSPIWTGEALLEILDHPTLELADLRPLSVGTGYLFSIAFTVDGEAQFRDRRGTS